MNRVNEAAGCKCLKTMQYSLQHRASSLIRKKQAEENKKQVYKVRSKALLLSHSKAHLKKFLLHCNFSITCLIFLGKLNVSWFTFVLYRNARWAANSFTVLLTQQHHALNGHTQVTATRMFLLWRFTRYCTELPLVFPANTEASTLNTSVNTPNCVQLLQ